MKYNRLEYFKKTMIFENILFLFLIKILIVLFELPNQLKQEKKIFFKTFN